MLKRDTTGRWERAPLSLRNSDTGYFFTAGKYRDALVFTKTKYLDILERQQHHPVLVMEVADLGRKWWMFKNEFWCENQGLEPEQVKALVLAQCRRRERQIQTAMSLVREEETPGTNTRTRIPDDVRLAVWVRDGGRCVRCGGTQDLEFDHIIPVSKGGSNSERNVQILCGQCNRSKGGSIA